MDVSATVTAAERDRHVTPAGVRRLVGLGLTARQAEVFLFVFGYTQARGHQPGLERSAAALGLGWRSSAKCHYDALVRKGWLAQEGGTYGSYGFARTPSGAPFLGFVPVEESWPS